MFGRAAAALQLRDACWQDILEGRERYERALAAAQLQSVQLLLLAMVIFDDVARKNH